MPQKLNKAGKMQDYIPAGNGDPSGEYGTSKGTNKNFTASDKKKTEANVITENKSVVVGDKGKTKEEYKLIPSKDLKIVDLSGKRVKGDDGKEYEIKKDTYGIEHNGKLVSKNARSAGGSNIPMGYDKKTIEDIINQGLVEEETAYIDEGYDKDQYDRWVKSGYEAKAKPRDNKANIIDGDLTGKKERAYDGSEYKSMSKEEKQKIVDKLEKAGFEKDTSYSGGRTYKIYDKNTGNWNSISFSEDGKLFATTINRGGFDYDDLDIAIDRATYKSGKAPSDKAIGWETGAYNDKVNDAYVRKHTKYDD